jgi:DNA repair protein RadC
MKSQKMAQFHDVINLPWLIHNHPSGDPTPSAADISMTREIRDVSAKLGLTLHDHIIVGRGRHASFKALGLL